MTNIIILIILLCLLTPAIYYIVKSKKNGQHCIGCPNAGACKKCTCNID